jgi:hypothetical protein
MDHLKANGQRAGTIPYGYALDANGKTLHSLPDELRWISQMNLWYAAGRPYRWIAHELNILEVPSKCGKQWHPKVVSAILKRHEREAANTECARVADK